MEIAKIAHGEVVEYPVSRVDCEAAIIATMPATVTVEETRMVTFEEIVDVEGEDGTVTQETITREVAQTVEVEIESQREFPLPDNLAGLDLSAHGFAVVEPTDPPEVEPGEVAERDGIELVDGVWRWKWMVRPGNADELEQAKVEKRAALKERYTERFVQGWTHDFGAAGVHTLDLRPGTDDKANWTLLLIKAQGMIAAGAAEAPVTIRTAANTSISVTATMAAEAMTAFLGWGEAMFADKWARDDAINDAETFADLAGIDIETGWPS
jgi:hypothetical protein